MLSSLVFDWSDIPNSSKWSFELNTGTDYGSFSYWRISSTIPQHDSPFDLIIIERNQEFFNKYKERKPLFCELTDTFLVITSREEIEGLIRSLSNTKPLEGNILEFLQHIPSCEDSVLEEDYQ